jgi:hypothetical protein
MSLGRPGAKGARKRATAKDEKKQKKLRDASRASNKDAVENLIHIGYLSDRLVNIPE